MKVLIIGQNVGPESGGGYFLQQRIIAALAATAGKHELFYISTNAASSADFEKIVENTAIEFIWCIAPFYPKSSVPFAVTVWDIAHRVSPGFPEVSRTGSTWEAREALYSQCLPRATMVITGNQRGKYELSTAYGIFNENIKVIPFPVAYQTKETEPHNENWTYSFEKKKYLFYPAQFWPHKNHVVLIKALRILLDEGLQFDLVFTGSDKGNLHWVKELTQLYNVKNYVHFLGFVPDFELIALYKNAFAMTYASMLGPNNLPPIEAMSHDCPVICASAPGMDEQLGDAALYFSPTSPDELARKIRYILDNYNANDLIKNGRNLVKLYSPEIYAENIIRCLDEFSAVRECWGESYVHL